MCNIRKKSDTADNWTTKSKNTDSWTCEDQTTSTTTTQSTQTTASTATAVSEICKTSDLDFQLKKKTGTDRDFNDNDWVMGTLSSCLVSGHLKCPTKEGRIARNIWFCCKANKKGLEWWRFKGDLDEALESPDDVACKKIPQN